MTTITITQADNDAALAAKEQAGPERFKFDVCKYCPVAQAFNRQFPPFIWLVNRTGARPEGARSYWYQFGKSLRTAISNFDRDQTTVTGRFLIFDSKHFGSGKSYI